LSKILVKKQPYTHPEGAYRLSAAAAAAVPIFPVSKQSRAYATSSIIYWGRMMGEYLTDVLVDIPKFPRSSKKPAKV
jgi:hypothetical protein